MAGRKPLPTVVAQLKGKVSFSARPSEPVPTGRLAEAPEHLSPGAKSAWDYAVAHAPANLLTKLDLSILEVWACAADNYRTAQKKILEEGMLVLTPNGMPMQSPYVTIASKQAMIMLRACVEMGFTPSSRTKVSVEREQVKDPWQEIAG